MGTKPTELGCDECRFTHGRYTPATWMLVDPGYGSYVGPGLVGGFTAYYCDPCAEAMRRAMALGYGRGRDVRLESLRVAP